MPYTQTCNDMDRTSEILTTPIVECISKDDRVRVVKRISINKSNKECNTKRKEALLIVRMA